MSVYLAMFGNAAAARNGLTAMPVDSAEDFFDINATNNLENNTGRDLYIRRVAVITAGIANLTTWRFKLTSEGVYSDFTTEGGVDQTGMKNYGSVLTLSKKFPKGAKLHCDLNNNNNSQVDVVVFWLSDTPNEPITMGANFDPPPGYQPYAFTGGTTVTAAVMTDVALTSSSFSPNAEGTYHIGGLLILGATAIAGRVKHRGENAKIINGALGGDIATPNTAMPTFGNFGSFSSNQYPIIKHKSVAADTAQRYILWIKQTGGPTV